MNGRDDLRDALCDRKNDVEVVGECTMKCLGHFNATGQEVPVTVLSPKSTAVWNDPDKEADLFYAMARRHAQGLQGAQQFQLSWCYGGSGKPSRTLPFLVAGASHIGGSHGLSTEPPTLTGQTQQGMRLLEILAQGSFSQVTHVTSVQASLIDKLTARLEKSEMAADQRWLAVYRLLMEQAQQNVSVALKSLGIRAAERLLPAVPAMLSSMTGSDHLLPAGEDSLLDTLLEQYSPAQLQEMLGKLGDAPGGGSAAALFTDHLVRAQKRRAARAAAEEKAEEKLMGGLTGRSYEEGELDAMGEAIRALRGRPAGTGGSATPHEATKVEPVQPQRGSDDLLDAILTTVDEGEVAALTAMLAAKRPDLPTLADDIKRRFATAQGRKAESA